MKKIIVIAITFFMFCKNCMASTVVMDMDNNRVLYENNKDEVKLIASTTKIMTALLALESNRVEEIVTVGDEVLSMYGSNIYIEKGEEMPLLDLIYGLMLRSGNDASVSIAKFVSGSIPSFVNDMNKKAQSLGMTNTKYENPNGLDDETQNYSSAYDLCLLYSYAYKYPLFRQIVASKYYKTTSSLKAYTWKNRNELLFNYDKATGGKTGYTPKAGRILVSSASNNDVNLCIATISKDSYLYDFHEKKYDYIFENYEKYKIIDKETFKIKGYDNAYVDHDFIITLSKQEYNTIKTDIIINEKKQGNLIGKVNTYMGKELIDTNNIYLKKEAKKLNLLDKIIQFFENILPF